MAAAEHLALPRIRRPPGRPFGDALRTARRLWTRAWTRCVALAPVGFAARLGLAASALILITCIAEAWILARGERERVAQYLSDRGRAISEQLAREAGPGVAAGKTQDLRQLAEQARVQRGLAYTRFFDRQGLLLASVGALPPGLAHPEVTPRAQTVGPMPIGGQLWEFHAPIFAPDGLATPAKTAQSRGRGASKFVHALEPVGTVAIGLQLEPLAAIQRRTVTTGSIVAALFTLAAVLTAIGLARHITRPLQALVGAADRIASGDLEARVAIATRDEVGNLGRHFNAMVESLGRSRAMLESYSRALEEKVEELEKANEVKSEFMATISHELRTPLNVIIGYTEMLADGAGGPLSEVQTGMLKAIQEYSQVQLALITNVLDFSRLSAGRVSFQIERFELAPLVEDVVTTYAKRVGDRPLRVSAAVAPDLPTLETDRRKVEEILRSLLDNALKFTERGTVSVVAKSGADGGSVVIEVEDTGPGIAAEEVSCLFDPFRQIGKSSTRRTGGLGLGLSIVKHLAEALGGAVSVSSRLGEGSTFRIEVPCALHGDGTALDADAPVIAVAALDVVSRRSEPRPLPTPARTAKAARP